VRAFFKILLKRFSAKWTRFAWDARHFCYIGANTAGQDAPAVTGAAHAEIA
jgi:hypothetical protein